MTQPAPSGEGETTFCPGCTAPMRALQLARATHGSCTVDLCEACHALWFDARESGQLGVGATLELFRTVRAAPAPVRSALRERLPCPRCGLVLVETHDLQRATRFRYWRCPRGHGRLTPFVQFLREKDFIRPLSTAELERLKAHALTVRCNGCGAHVDLKRDMVCAYCRAPIEMLDPDAAARALSALREAEQRAGHVDVDRLADALLAGQAQRDRRPAWAFDTPPAQPAGVDLVVVGLSALVDLVDGC